MNTKILIKPNDKPGISEIHWPTWISWLMTVISGLIIVGVPANILVAIKLYILDAEVQAFHDEYDRKVLSYDTTRLDFIRRPEYTYDIDLLWKQIEMFGYGKKELKNGHN